MAPSDRERDRRTTLEDAREITCREFMDIPGVLIVGSGCRWTAPKGHPEATVSFFHVLVVGPTNW